MSIGHQQQAQSGRFYTEPDGPDSAEMTYTREGEVIYVNSTLVPEQFRGQGIAMQLMEAMVAFAALEGLQVVPRCSYVETMFKRHPQWQPLLHQPLA